MTAPPDLRDLRDIEADLPSPALAAMSEEVRSEKPEIDWAKLEARLFDERGEVRAPAPRRRSAMFGALAFAAAFAVAIFSPTRAVEELAPPVAKVQRAAVVQAGVALAVGSAVEGGFEGTWLKSLGRVSVRVEPGARAVLVDDGERIRFALERGAITADVTPVPGGEPFAIDVAGKRVAVHGTHLRVALVNGAVEVAVSEGNAVIGEPMGDGRTEGPLVLAGSVGTFASVADLPVIKADPSRATSLVEDALAMRKHVEAPPAKTVAQVPTLAPTIVNPPSVPKTEASVAIAETASAAPSVAPSAAPVLPGLSEAHLAAPLALVDLAVKKCLPAVLPSGASFTADLELEISALGKIVDPALSSVPPERRECVRTALAKIDFPAAPGPTKVERKIVISGK